MKYRFLFTFVFLTLCGFLQSQNSEIQINGEVKNLTNNKLLYYSFKIKDRLERGICEIKENKFVIRVNEEFPILITLHKNSSYDLAKNTSCKFYVDSESNKVLLDYLNFENSQIIGSKADVDYKQYVSNNNKYDSIRKKLSQFSNEYYNLSSQNQNSQISDKYKKKNDSIDSLLKKNQEIQLLADLKYTKTNPNSEWMLEKIYIQLNRDIGRKYLDTIADVFDGMSINAKSSKIGVKMKNGIENIRRSAVGQVAPEITGLDLNGTNVSLLELRNKKYVLLDFWATWCAPCREDFGFLRESYKKFNTKGLEIISISKDENLDMWKKIIQKDSVQDWIHYSIKFNKSDVEEKYMVTAIPVKILIDLNGKIIGRWKGGGNENKIEVEKLLSEIFK